MVWNSPERHSQRRCVSLDSQHREAESVVFWFTATEIDDAVTSEEKLKSPLTGACTNTFRTQESILDLCVFLVAAIVF